MKATVGLLGLAASVAMAGGGSSAGGGGAVSGGAGAVGGAVGAIGDLAGGVGGIGGGGFLGDISGTLSMGYDSAYYFRGTELGENPIWAGVDLELPVGEGVTLNPGIWYVNPTEGGGVDDELDYYVNLGWDTGSGVGVGLHYTAYTYPEAGGDTHEIGGSLGYSLGALDLGLGYFYDVDLETDYLEASAGTTYDVADGVGLSLSLKAGHDTDDFTHILAVASLPIALTDAATLESYIAGNFALDVLEGVNDDDEELFGGVSLSVSF